MVSHSFSFFFFFVRFPRSLTHPLTAMSLELMDEVHDILDRLKDDKVARVVIMRGEGKGFCSGADLLASAAGIGGRKWNPKDYNSQRYFSNVIRKMRALDQPIIAAVHGAARSFDLFSPSFSLPSLSLLPPTPRLDVSLSDSPCPFFSFSL